jgi:hypothetical protein
MYNPLRHRITLLLPAILCCATAIPATAAALGSLTTVPVPFPAATGSLPPGIAATLAIGANFTGTWTTPVAAEWLGTFNGTGPYPLSANGAGVSDWNFTTLDDHILPIDTYFRLGDLDQSTAEKYIFTAFDAAHVQITTDWLDAPIFASSLTAADLIPGSMPEYSVLNGVYTFDGGGVAGNPTLTVTLLNNVAISFLSVQKFSNNNSFGLAAPTPEPGTMFLLGLGLAALGLRRKAKLRDRL